MRQAEGYMNEIGKNGLWSFWNEKGSLTEQGDYKDGQRVGLWTYWDKNGKKKEDVEFKNGKRID
jgi:antitoxin component YwqK of YwqJK toxin-antitoxin module